VRHGDIKSNNVKENIHTGNYVLLDFGLAIMSDEQRRSSLRHAGAIEFMAPEQNEGQMLCETDVYSFGVVLFELVAGVVPFPLKDKGETARNNVMIAHMETSPPNVLSLRQQNLPAGWSDDKKELEMQVPAWLVKLIYKCLEKKPAERFANGVDLHEYIVRNSIVGVNNTNVSGTVQLSILEQEVERLQRENSRLQEQLFQYQNTTGRNNSTGSTLTINGEVESNSKKKSASLRGKNILLILLIAVSLIAVVYAFLNKTRNKNPSTVLSSRSVIGKYKIAVPKAYFHNQPDESTKRDAYATPSNYVVSALEEKNGFVYTEITNTQGQTSKGWLHKQDLATAHVNKINNTANTAGSLSERDITIQLGDAAKNLEAGRTEEALALYQILSQQEVPEAMYQYGNMALQNRNKRINCKQGFDLLMKASNKGYTPAKRTLGLLYGFANDHTVLKENNYYDRCTFSPSIKTASKLLMEAMLEGDLTAGRLLQALNDKNK
jgi:serine/threonine-protein kinase